MNTLLPTVAACLLSVINVNAQLTEFDHGLLVQPENDENGLVIHQHPAEGYGFGLLVKTERDDTKALSLIRWEDNDTKFTVWGNGVVNIRKLYALEIEVRPDAMGLQWPDYVFESCYDRLTIDETKDFISTHHHLPYLPSAAAVEEKGYDVTQLNMQLLETIENLSLQIIELNERLKALELEGKNGN